MPQRNSVQISRFNKKRAAALFGATAVIAGAWSVPLLAQDTELRTTLSPVSSGASSTEQSALRELAATQVYDPVSPGALPDTNEASSSSSSQSIFDDAGGGDLFQSTPPVASGAAATIADQPETAEAESAGATAGVSSEITGALPAERQAQQTIELNEANMRAQRVTAIEAKPSTFEETPFSPVGIRAGKFNLFPSLEQGVVATSNADSSSDGEAATLSETTLRLTAVSDWSRHSASASGFGTYRKSISGEEIETFYGGLNSQLQLDLANAYTLNATADYLISPESATSPVVIEGTLDEPIRQEINASLGLSKEFGKLQLTGTGRVEREIYGDADLSTGGTISQKDRNSTLAAFVLRTGWELSPALTPFVEAEIGKRIYDNRNDSAGYQRSALRTGLRGGVAFDITEKVEGEVSAGWVSEDFDDTRLRTLSGATFDADLSWSPMRGTIIALNGNTTVEGTTTPGEAGSILYSAALSATRELRANLTGNATVGIGWRDFKDSDDRDLIWNAETSLTYWFNRYAGLTGRARYEKVESDLPFRDAETASVFLGIRLQR